MSQVVTESFKQNLFCPPNGEKKANPTIFDEMRWAIQHSENPLGQITQLISEFHGVWTGVSEQLVNFISYISSLSSNGSSNSILKSSQEALKLISALTMPSNIGRINNISCNQMSLELLREFVSRAQCIHPSVNAYIQNNIGKYPYFQQISESVCSFGQIVLKKPQVDVMKRPNTDGDTNMSTNFRLRRNTNSKLFDNLKTLVDNTSNLVETMFIRGMQIDNNMALLHQQYATENAIPHGHNMTMDVFDANRSKAAIQTCISDATQKFGDSLRLCDWAFPVDHQIQKQPQWYTLQTELGQYIADELNRPVAREVKIPIAQEDNKTAVV